MNTYYGYYSYARYLEATGNPQMHKVPLDLGLGCPNRSPDGLGGCSFCPTDGARAVQLTGAETIEQQVEAAIDFAKRRYGAKRFVAYVQAFTGTFAAASEQRELYDRILSLFPFSALHVGTRPDCLSDDTITFLQEIGTRLDVAVELGVQTSHDRTLKRINRGHDWECSVNGIHKLHETGIPVIAHIILGLPGESPDDFNETAERLATLPLAGIKIHNLHVLEGTVLGAEYKRSPFPVLNEFEYLDALMGVLRRLPSDLPVLRVTTDSPEDDLIAPKWQLSKGQFIELLERHLAFRLYRQGDLCDGDESSEAAVPGESPVETKDGSITFWSPVFKEHYHAKAGAKGEAMGKYVVPSHLRGRLQAGPIKLLDVCFGLGYNTLSACSLASELATHPLNVTALEIDRGVVRDAATHAAEGWVKNALTAVFENGRWADEWASIAMHWGDARHTIETAAKDGPFDLVYLDAFSTQRNSELWTVEFFRKLYDAMTDNGELFTYCAALPVRSGLIQAGFNVGNTPAYGRERPGTIATKRPDGILFPLSEQERHNIETSTKGIPFHDPHGVASNREILKLREQRVKEFKAGTS